MASGIYVWPRDLLLAIYNDLKTGSKVVRGLDIVHKTEIVEGHECYKVEVVLDTCSRLSKTGRINLEACGISRDGVIEAERDAVIGIIEALRATHGIYPADFNHIEISEERHLYIALQAVTADFHRTYDRLEEIVKNCHNSMAHMLATVSKLLGDLAVDGQRYEEVVTFSAFHATLSHASPQVDTAIYRARHLLHLAIDHDDETEEQRRFATSVPMPMVIDWDVSFSVLQAILEEAKKQLNLQISEITAVPLDDGQFRANITITVDPYRLYGPNIEEAEVKYYSDPHHFSSTPYPSELGAKARVIHKALEYVRYKLHRPIIDLNYELFCKQNNFCGNFRGNMKTILGHANALASALRTCEDNYRWATADLKNKIPETEHTAAILGAISQYAGVLAEARNAFTNVWDTLMANEGKANAILGSKYKLF